MVREAISDAQVIKDRKYHSRHIKYMLDKHGIVYPIEVREDGKQAVITALSLKEM